MPELKANDLEAYLSSLFKKPVTLTGLAPLGESPIDRSIKFGGYGIPMRLDYQAGSRAQDSRSSHHASWSVWT